MIVVSLTGLGASQLAADSRVESAENNQILIEVVGDGVGYDILGNLTTEVAAYRSMSVPKSFDVIADSKGAYIDIPEPRSYGLLIGFFAFVIIALRR